MSVLKPLKEKDETLPAAENNISGVTVSNEAAPYREKPDSVVEKRIDAHELFSLFTGSVIKNKKKWFR